MSASKYKLSIEQGATFRRTFTWKAGTPPVPVDLTGCAARSHFRGKVEDATPLFEMSTANGLIELGGVAGTISLEVPAAASSGFNWRTGVYDLEITMADGSVRRLIAGTVAVSPEVTRG